MAYGPASAADGVAEVRNSLTPLIALLFGVVAPPSYAAGCPPVGSDRAALEALKTSKFEIADDASRQTLALALVPCLADPAADLRDGIAFEAYSTWLRADRLDVATRTELLTRLSASIQPDQTDRDGFRQPFAALVLSEVARTDRITPWLTPVQRAALVERAAQYVASVRDYRGFDEKDGWRHGVAHGADLLMQLALNPAVDRAGLDHILSAVAAQVMPDGDHSYIDGESERLVRPVLFAAQRGVYTRDDWERWLEKIAAPANGRAAFGTRAALARHHNQQAFLYALYVNARESGDPNMQTLVPGLQVVFKTLR
jgi:hypothetical protein